MEADFDSSIKSRPLYQAISINDKAIFSLFVVEAGQDSNLQALYQFCDTQKAIITLPLTELSDSSLKGFERTICPDVLSVAFANLPMSAQLYVSGSEAFLWDVHKLAVQAGLLAEQIRLSQPTTPARRVFCTHCYNQMENVLHTPVECSGCGLPLLVRDHFSRRLGAYVGLNINAEDKTELPAREALK
ncbi:dimethylamine monooxygenase subunit DmmA family protein [Marinomonas sp. THO17]|uniref:dimethylamine monooxygenase subunit DmmA family protein n=1 Tax=Marinomonas sp. THO17 TaxID=3149048 RepID=UPI00336BB989